MFIILPFILSASKPKSPERPSAEDLALERARKIAQERRKLPPGDPPVFRLRLPKVVELEEGDRLRLECRAEGTPEPMGKRLFCTLFSFDFHNKREI